jgi:spore coat polysaccharide biosynthesis protein SpsF (cytidylyltransferase family)
MDRLTASKRLDVFVVATTDLVEDDPIEKYCKEFGIACYRGSPNDLLDRITCAYLSHGADVGVIVYGDGPMIDPLIIDQGIELYESFGSFDFVGNDLLTTFPAGMEVEVFSIDALCRSRSMCTDSNVREHGTLFLRQNPKLFRIHNFEAVGVLRRPDLSLEVDTPEDLEVFDQVAKHLNTISSFSLNEIIRFVDANNLKELNEHIPRRWKKYRLQ